MSKKGHSALIKAKSKKNDEFYTQISDIENELKHYRNYFKDAVIFCNCDDPEYSNFWKYFYLNFKFFGLKRLISTHFEREVPSYKLEAFLNDEGGGLRFSKLLYPKMVIFVVLNVLNY